MAALRQAGTKVCEPIHEFRLEFPADVLGPMMTVLRELDARPRRPATQGSTTVIEGGIRVARLHGLQSRLPEMTRGEGVLESTFAGYRPIVGAPPSRPRTDRNPLDRTDYLRRLSRT
jgi:ribosomal protection tetracycline resistance protein